MSDTLAKTPLKLDEAAQKRLAELKIDYHAAKKRGDTMRISQCILMAKSIRAGERTFIYDLPGKNL